MRVFWCHVGVAIVPGTVQYSSIIPAGNMNCKTTHGDRHMTLDTTIGQHVVFSYGIVPITVLLQV